MADLALIAQAPARLNRAGVGDLLSIHTGRFDWALGARPGRSPFDAGDRRGRRSGARGDLRARGRRRGRHRPRARRHPAPVRGGQRAAAAGRARRPGGGVGALLRLPRGGRDRPLVRARRAHRPGHRADVAAPGQRPGPGPRLPRPRRGRLAPAHLGLDRATLTTILAGLPAFVRGAGLPHSIIDEADLAPGRRSTAASPPCPTPHRAPPPRQGPTPDHPGARATRSCPEDAREDLAEAGSQAAPRATAAVLGGDPGRAAALSRTAAAASSPAPHGASIVRRAPRGRGMLGGDAPDLPAVAPVVHIVGARPNFIKAAPGACARMAALGVPQRLVHTGQHYDARMSDVFFRDLDLPEPDVSLGVGSGTPRGPDGRAADRARGRARRPGPSRAPVARRRLRRRQLHARRGARVRQGRASRSRTWRPACAAST